MYGTYYLNDDALTAKRAGGFTKDYVQGPYGGLIPDTGFSWQKVIAEARERTLVEAVIDRLKTEAVALGAHGIVSIRLAWHRRPDLDFGELQVHDVNGVGLAVKVPTVRFEQEPFTAALTCGEVCTLLADGLTPVKVVFGVGSVRADMGNRTRQHMRSLGQIEVPQFSEAVEKSLALASSDLQRNGGDGQIIVGCKPELTFERVVGAGLECKVRILGTATRRFLTHQRPEILPIMRLNDRPGG